MVLVIDNYDSFTYNLVQYLRQLGAETVVRRNDEIDLKGVALLDPDAVVLSPGPGRPEEAGVTLPLIEEFHATLPILGVCLGHQAIARAFGAEVVGAGRLMHGKTSAVFHDGKGVFAGLPSPFEAGRYHSLIVRPETIPPCLEVGAQTAEGEIMALRHHHYLVEGVQFHPESVLTPKGKRLLRNFLEMAKGERRCAA